jgi:hypothetical protein
LVSNNEQTTISRLLASDHHVSRNLDAVVTIQAFSFKVDDIYVLNKIYKKNMTVAVGSKLFYIKYLSYTELCTVYNRRIIIKGSEGCLNNGLGKSERTERITCLPFDRSVHSFQSMRTVKLEMLN